MKNFPGWKKKKDSLGLLRSWLRGWTRVGRKNPSLPSPSIQ